MVGEFVHLPVMAGEVVDLLLPVPSGLIVDCTVGGGGHAALLLDARPDWRLLGIDRDAEALAAAREHLDRFGDRVEFVVPHCDPNVNLYDRMFAVRGEEVVAVWNVDARGRVE